MTLTDFLLVGVLAALIFLIRMLAYGLDYVTEQIVAAIKGEEPKETEW